MRQQTWEYLDAELGADDLAGIGRHIVRCVECRRVLAFDRAFLELLRRQRAAVAPGDLVWQVRVALRSAPM